MRGRFWRKVIIKRGENVAYPDTIDGFRTTENRPGIKYDPAKKTTLFAEDLKALGDSIISVQNAIGTFDLSEQGMISDQLDMCLRKDDLNIYELPWDATIKQAGQDLQIPALASRALFSKGFVKLIAFYKAPEIPFENSLYLRLPRLVMHNGVDKDVYFLDAFYFQYKFQDSPLKYFGRGVAQFSASQPLFIFLNFQSPVTGRYPNHPDVVCERQVSFDNNRFFIKDSIIKLQLEYLTNV